jgi:hypothetical protein
MRVLQVGRCCALRALAVVGGELQEDWAVSKWPQRLGGQQVATVDEDQLGAEEAHLTRAKRSSLDLRAELIEPTEAAGLAVAGRQGAQPLRNDLRIWHI